MTPRAPTKAPTEQRAIGYDFSTDLAPNETILTMRGMVAYNDGADPPNPALALGDLALQNVNVNGNLGTAIETGGIAATDYLVTFIAGTSAGQVIPRSILQLVDLP